MRAPLLLESRDYLPSEHMPVAVTNRYPQEVFAEHTHQFCEIVIVWRGNGLHVLNDHPYRITCGDVFYIQAQDHHSYESVHDLVLDNIIYCPERLRLNAQWHKLLPPFGHEQNQGYWRLTTEGMAQARPIIQQLAQESRKTDSWSIQLTEALLLQLAIVLKRHRYRSEQSHLLPDGEQLDLIMSALQQSLGVHFDMADFCFKNQLVERSLKQLFRQQTGMSINHYLRQIRLCHAKCLLRGSEHRISDIAARCGFEDSNYFSAVFTREAGMTPRDYRQRFIRTPAKRELDSAEQQRSPII
ncbi:HTH-type transcriptional activator RhaR [Yersinia massiliensis]|uniref:HTH-type transcriptional activator RhaR n=1 Tax=Yersinia massiliensis TaxID=419257 RepID=A0AA91BAW8_9GAMM|nr:MULTISPECIES: HTH-type transcriptional activator RhaR [Yersinia]MDA5548205.1 HTH-type transcriptional activator RhaR [Yersinia massiliensis]NIL26815.1 HTH-type transcriptional activator RhaR [Yersinia massiliensis]OWF74283.1 AraC family transcriptional regulator [Yersinia frederiksenii]PHZ23337.1 HTH-type transcriptional activator RhaR [Yersinia massiliensis]UZM78508.1 HTH-type transcriptional activator RhaR [Yersinia massiliensis]